MSMKSRVGTPVFTCPQLKVHGTKVEDVNSDEYLGDIICADGNNKANIQKRIGRGFGIISEIINILSQISYGYHYFEIALLLRTSLFLSSVLNNVEVMYNFSKADGEKFDAIDLTLMRKVLKAPKSTPKEAFYLELGIIPPSVLIKVSRMNYLHYLLRKQRSEIISMFFLGSKS